MLPERIYRPEIFFVVSLGFVSQRKRGGSTPRRSLKGLRPSGKNWYGSATRKCVASRRSESKGHDKSRLRPETSTERQVPMLRLVSKPVQF